jgi:hypothetical protein
MYTVTAPYLQLIADQEGRMYDARRGDRLAWLNDQQRDHFLALGLVTEDTGSASELAPGPEWPAFLDRPAESDPKEHWVRFGVAKGNEPRELQSLDKEDLIDLLSGL